MNTLPKTIFEMPIISAILRWTSIAVLHLLDWRYKNVRPNELLAHKFVLIGAPHTSALDVPFMLMIACALRLPPVYWVGKKELFGFPFNYLLCLLGGIPVDRSTKNNMVGHLTQILSNSHKSMCIMFAPEGTRNGDGTWKTGFYHTAVASNLPIALGYIDYSKRRGGVASFFRPTGKLEEDIEIIMSFYEPIKRRNM